MVVKLVNFYLKIFFLIGGWILLDLFYFMYDVEKRNVFVDLVKEFL